MKGLFAVLVATLLGHSGLSLSVGGAQHHAVNTHPVAAAPGVVVRNEVGNVSVVNGPGAVTVSKYWTLRKPSISIRREGAILVVEAKCPDNAPLNNCSVDLTVAVPQPLALDARSAVGDVTLRGLVGNFSARSGVGEIVADGLRGDALTVRAGSGDATLRNLDVRRVDAVVSNGDVTVDSAGAPDALDAHGSNGSIDVGVPAGAYAITTDLNWGDATITGLVNDSHAARRINATTDNGDVSVHAR